MKSIYFILAIGGLLLAASCKKTSSTTTTNDPSVAGKTKQEIFMMQKWKLASVIDSNTTQNNADITDPADKDDIYNFVNKNLYLLDRGKLNNGDSAKQYMPWNMASGNASTVTIYGLSFNIVRQSSTAITLQRVYTNGGYPTLQTYTFGKY